jgi:Undecaprenyl-phosphate galactose phosphotransferase WbaP
MYPPIFLLFFWGHSLYPGVSLAPAEELRRFFTGSVLVYVCILFSRYVEDTDIDAVTIAFTISFLFSVFLLLVCRSSMRRLLSITHLGGIPAVVYGSGLTARLLIDKLQSKRWAGYMPVVIVDDDPATGDRYTNIPIIHDISAGSEIVKNTRIKMAIVAIDDLPDDKIQELQNYYLSAFRYFVIVPESLGAINIWMSVRDFGGILGFATSHRLKMFWNLALKRAMDLVIVILGGILISPLLLLIAVLVKLSSPGPAFYAHTRIGLNGRQIKMYKFRSMCADADKKLAELLENNPTAKKEWEKEHKLKDDPRITPLGNFLRKSSLDELPQLYNILKGDMSLVGPRPVTFEERQKYGTDFERIFSVRPGLTGMWQVSGRSEASYADRVMFDTYYLQSWSIWLDFWILYKTLGVVLNKRGAY